MEKLVKNILISGYYGFSNAGDELVLGEIIKGLRKEKDLEITVLSASPQITAEKYEVIGKDRWSLWQILASIYKTDLLVSGGGSLLQDKTSKNGILYYLAIIFFALLMRKKIVIFSQGIGPIDHKRNRKITSFLLNKVNMIYVRDEDSLNYLQKMGLKKEINLSADPVFLLEKSSEDLRRGLWEKLGLDFKRKLILVSLRPWSDQERVLAASAEFLNDFDPNLYQIKYLTFHKGEDDLLLEGQPSKDDLIKDDLEPEEAASLIGGADLVLGMRLHSLILAAAQEVPFIAISYDPKVDALDKAIYPASIFVDTKNISSKKLSEKYSYVKEKKYSNEDFKKRALRPFKEIL